MTMTHKSPPKDEMDVMVMAVITRRPGIRLADIHHDNGTPGMSYQDTRSTLERLIRNGRVDRKLKQQGWFLYYRYYVK